MELWQENFTWQQEQLWSFQETVTIKTLLLFYYYYWFSLLSMCWKTIHLGHCRSASTSWLLTESYSFLLLLLSSPSGEMRGTLNVNMSYFACLLDKDHRRVQLGRKRVLGFGKTALSCTHEPVCSTCYHLVHFCLN